MQEQIKLIVGLLFMVEVVVVSALVLVVLACIVKGAWDDSVRLYNYLYIRWQERKPAVANSNDEEFFKVVSHFYDKV